ncbi:hypothetical protein F52700_4277 [Fusarium sp. NRRL 52700]|nr:hypothetical protein F52700_4277 [Fusarium sp. NRRL 52700]
MNYQVGSFVDSELPSHRNDDLVSPQPALPRWTGLEQGCVDAEISGIFQDTTMYAGVDSDTSLGWSTASSLDIDFDPSPYPSLNYASSLDVDFNLSSYPSLDDTSQSGFGSGLDFGIVHGRYQPRMVPTQVEPLSSHWDFTFDPFPPQLLHGPNLLTPSSADKDVSDLAEGHQMYKKAALAVHRYIH